MKLKTLWIAFGLFPFLSDTQASTLYWQGTAVAGSATWDTSSSYWSTTDFTSPNTTFTTGADVVFGKFYSYTTTNKNAVVDLAGGSVTANSITFNIPAGTSGITYTVQNGTINLNSSGTSLSKTGSRGDADTINAAINLGASTTWDIQTGQVFANGAVTGAGNNLTKTGSGILQFSGTTTNTFNNLTITDGIVQVAGATAAFAGNLTIGDGVGSAGSAVWSSQTYRTTLTGKNVTINSDGVFKLGSGGTNPIGELTLAGGYITSYNTSMQLFSATKITATANTTQNDALVSEIRLATSGSTEIAVNSGVTFTLGNVVSQSPVLLKTGDGTLTLSAANTYTGGNAIRAGKVRVLASSLDNTAGALGQNSATTAARSVALGDSSSGASDIALINGAAGITTQRRLVVSSAGTGAVTIGGDHTSGTSTFSAYTGLNNLELGRSVNLTSAAGGTVVFTGTLTGQGGVTKVGGGTVSLDGASNYTGVTNVSEGELSVNGSVASATTNVSSGATLSGSGQVGGNVNVTSGTVRGSGLNVAGTTTFAGNSTLAGTVTSTHIAVASAGSLNVTGTTSSSINVNGLLNGTGSTGAVVLSGGTLNGTLSTGVISGTGLVSPGSSPGILTATSVTVSSGLNFGFELTQATPDYTNALASGNDLLHLTGGTPFSANLGTDNTISVYFSSAELGSVFQGGFFVDNPASALLLQAVSNATFAFYVQDAEGSVAFNDQSYRALDNSLISVAAVTVPNAGFASGSVSGSTLEFAVVPEPGTWAMFVGGIGLLAFRQRLRRRSAA